MVMAPWMGMIDLKDNTMKITKQRLKQMIREELEILVEQDWATAASGFDPRELETTRIPGFAGKKRAMTFDEPEEVVVDMSDVERAGHEKEMADRGSDQRAKAAKTFRLKKLVDELMDNLPEPGAQHLLKQLHALIT